MSLLVRYLHRVRIYWEDTDAGGIVFYGNYLKFFERARTEWLRSVGVEQQSLLRSSGGMFVVSATSLKYHAPARLDDELLVVTSVLAKRGASLRVAQRAVLDNPAVLEALDANVAAPLLCESEVRIGWVDAASMRPARIPRTILDVL